MWQRLWLQQDRPWTSAYVAVSFSCRSGKYQFKYGPKKFHFSQNAKNSASQIAENLISDIYKFAKNKDPASNSLCYQTDSKDLRPCKQAHRQWLRNIPDFRGYNVIRNQSWEPCFYTRINEVQCHLLIAACSLCCMFYCTLCHKW